jgi:hypothetical protein
MVRPAIIDLATAAIAAASPLSGLEKRTTNTSTVFSFAEVRHPIILYLYTT